MFLVVFVVSGCVICGCLCLGDCLGFVVFGFQLVLGFAVLGFCCLLVLCLIGGWYGLLFCVGLILLVRFVI